MEVKGLCRLWSSLRLFLGGHVPPLRVIFILFPISGLYLFILVWMACVINLSCECKFNYLCGEVKHR